MIKDDTSFFFFLRMRNLIDKNRLTTTKFLVGFFQKKKKYLSIRSLLEFQERSHLD